MIFRLKTYRKLITSIKIIGILLALFLVVFSISSKYSIENVIIFMLSLIVLLILGIIRYKMIQKVYENYSSDNWLEILKKMESKGVKYL